MDPSTARPRGTTLSRRKLAFWAVAFGVGAYIGYRIASSDQEGFGAITAVALAVTILLILAVFAVVGWFTPGKAGRPAARSVIVASVLLAVGVGVGLAITPILWPEYRAPVILETSGTVSVSLDGLDSYAAHTDALATCRSVMNAEGVAVVQADAVGTVGTDRVAASMSILSYNDRAEVIIQIVPAVTGEGEGPAWQGSADVLERTDGDRSGRLAFTGATLIATDQTQPDAWPAELSGTLTWSCGPWR